MHVEVVKSTLRKIFFRLFVIRKIESNDVADERTFNEELISTSEDIVLNKTQGQQLTAQCGHISHKTIHLFAYGTKITIDGKIRCPECAVEEAKSEFIRCAMCGLAIIPGESVAMYDEVNILPYKKVGIKIGRGYLACMRWDCCPSGGLLAGHWMGCEKGFVELDWKAMTKS